MALGDDFSVPPEEKSARIGQIMEGMFGQGWQARMRGQAPQPAAPAAPAGQQAPAQAAPAAPANPAATMQRPPTVPPGSQYSPSRRMWRDPQGKMYDQQGNPAS